MSGYKVRVIFQDGTIFHGKMFAKSGDRYAEVVFNTGLTGYQEILTDPSYKGQAVVMTYPMIGNYGVNPEDVESRQLYLEALIVKEYCDHPSNWRSTQTLKQYLEEHDVLGIEGIDTRALTKYIRNKGACKAAITSFAGPPERFTHRLRHDNPIFGINMVHDASCDRSYVRPRPDTCNFRVAVIDCGLKHNILNILHDHHCQSTVFSSISHLDKIHEGNFDGIMISNGPGDPEHVFNVVEMVRNFLGKIPIFGICLGHQILGLALNARTYKLKFGHHGLNHPILNTRTGKVEMTSQNHNFAIDPESLAPEIEVSHLNLNDNTVAGIRHREWPAFSVQYHPEAAPGPQDSRYLFGEFVGMMQNHKIGRAVK